MTSKRRATLMRIGLVASALTAGGEAGASASWYDAEPLLLSLRAPERAEAQSILGNLHDLPLYELELELGRQSSDFSLREVIYFTNREQRALSEIVLRIYADSGNQQRLVKLRTGRCIETRCSIDSPAVSVLRVRPKSAIAPRGRLRIVLELEGRLERLAPERTTLLGQGMEAIASMGGGASARHSVLAQAAGTALLSSFYPVLARRERGAWVSSEKKLIGDLGSDELGHVRARIRTPPDVRAEANGLSVSESVLLHARGRGNHLREKQIVAACVRDFVLVTGAALKSKTRLVGDVAVSSVFLPGHDDAGEHVLDVAADSLARFERRFGRYPFTRLSIAEAPLSGAGGIEFSGMAVVGSMLYQDALAGAPAGLAELKKLLASMVGKKSELAAGIELTRLFREPARARSRQSRDPKRSSRAKPRHAPAGVPDLTRSMREFVTAHEVAHQWWHGLIGSDSQAHPFVDESLAQYSTLLYLEDRYGKARAEREAIANVKLGYLLMRASGLPDGRVSRAAEQFPSSLAYAGLVYGKAPYFFHELRQELGDRAFFERLRAHADRHRFRSARPEALLDAFAIGSHRSEVQRLAERWLEQAHGDEDMAGDGLFALLGRTLGSAGTGAGFDFTRGGSAKARP